MQENCFEHFAIRKDGFCKFIWASKEEQDLIKPLCPTAMLGFATDKQITIETLNQQLIPALEVLPMRCWQSPVCAMLKYDAERPFIAATTNTLQSIWNLYQFQVWFMSEMKTFQSKGDTRWQLLHKVLRENKARAEWYPNLVKDLKKFEEKKQAAGILTANHKDAGVCMKDFAELLMLHTLKLIHILETIIHDCQCIVLKKKDLKIYLTKPEPVPVEFPYVDQKHEANDTIQMSEWFQQKENIKKTGIIRGQAINTIMTDQRNNDKIVFRRFIPYITLWEYYETLIKQIKEA